MNYCIALGNGVLSQLLVAKNAYGAREAEAVGLLSSRIAD